MRTRVWRVVLVAVLAAAAACSSAQTHAGLPPTIAAAGDIACDPDASKAAAPTKRTSVPPSTISDAAPSDTTDPDEAPPAAPDTCRMAATAALVARQRVAGVLALGDIQYEKGDLASFQRSYDPTWGRFKDITHPAVGNHEYGTHKADGYFAYFGGAAGQLDQGWYSFDVGSWHLIALNSNCAKVGGCDKGSPQERWLSQDLSSHKNDCVLAYWHHPRFSSGQHGDEPQYDAFWRDLYDQGGDVVLVGHDHDYERFAPQDPDGKADPSRGVREFVVGTGGKNHYGFHSPDANSELREGGTFGVLLITLNSTSYDWKFSPEGGKSFSDSGHGACH